MWNRRDGPEEGGDKGILRGEWSATENGERGTIRKSAMDNNHMWCDLERIAGRWLLTFTKTIYDRSPYLTAAEVKYYEEGGTGRLVDNDRGVSAEDTSDTK